MRSANQYLFSLALAVAAWLAVNVSSLQTWLLYGAHNASVSQSELDVRGWACSLLPFCARLIIASAKYMLAWIMTYDKGLNA